MGGTDLPPFQLLLPAHITVETFYWAFRAGPTNSFLWSKAFVLRRLDSAASQVYMPCQASSNMQPIGFIQKWLEVAIRLRIRWLPPLR
jgi:hypothetical protein